MSGPSYSCTINLSGEAVKYVEFVMENERMNRSQAVSYLIRMGYIYRYNVLVEELKKEALKREEENK